MNIFINCKTHNVPSVEKSVNLQLKQDNLTSKANLASVNDTTVLLLFTELLPCSLVVAQQLNLIFFENLFCLKSHLIHLEAIACWSQVSSGQPCVAHKLSFSRAPSNLMR